MQQQKNKAMRASYSSTPGTSGNGEEDFRPALGSPVRKQVGGQQMLVVRSPCGAKWQMPYRLPSRSSELEPLSPGSARFHSSASRRSTAFANMNGLGSSALAVMRSPSQAISGSGSLSSPPVKKPTLVPSAAAAGAPAAPTPAAPTLAAPTLAAALPTYGKSSNSALKRLAKERGLKQAGEVLKRNQKFDLWQQDSASHPAPGEEGGPTPAAGAKTMARTSGSASSSNGSGEEPAIEALMERARSSEFGANLSSMRLR